MLHPKSFNAEDVSNTYGIQCKKLAEILFHTDSILHEYDDKKTKSWELAYAILEIIESCKVINEKLWPALYEPNINCEKRYDLYIDLVFELRHIIYHIYNSPLSKNIIDDINLPKSK